MRFAKRLNGPARYGRMTLLALSLLGCLETHGAPIDAREPTQQPIDSPMIVAPGFDEALVATGPTTENEDQAANAAVEEFQLLGVRGTEAELTLAPFERYVVAHPSSGWTPSIYLNLGLAYYRFGYFTKAMGAWRAAWEGGKGATEPMAKALVDRAVGELAQMHARVGHSRELEGLFSEIGDRAITGPATELVTGAHEGLWMMRNQPGEAFLCGPKALRNLLGVSGASREAMATVDDARSGSAGFTLEEVSALASSTGFSHRLVYRAPGQPIPVPSVINWKLDHYAAIVSEQDGYYQIKDPTFGGDLSLSRKAIDAEGSGYFLVPQTDHMAPEWRDVTLDEARSVHGMGYVTTNQAGRVTKDDVLISPKCSGSDIGMCRTNAHAMVVSAHISDTPVGYEPQRGPAVRIQVSYNQRETTSADLASGQPANPTFFNMGPKWTLNVLSYVVDSPWFGAIVSSTGRYIPGGGGRFPSAFYNSSTGRFGTELLTGAVLTRTPTTGTATSYTLEEADGSTLVYAHPDSATSGNRRVFLSKIIDAQGNELNLAYDSIHRLTTITDAANRVTTFAYAYTGASTQFLVTRITDPFGRFASFSYDANRRLISITDAIGITSTINYDASGLVNSLGTPYGVTLVNYADAGHPNAAFCPGDVTARCLEITDPLGGVERVEFNQAPPAGNPPTHGAETPGQIPFVDSLGSPTGMVVDNSHLQYRNTFYWNPHALQTYGRDYSKAKVWNWHHADSDTAAPTMASEKEPLENRVWYNYEGQELSNPANARVVGSTNQPSATGRILDDGSTQLFRATQNPRHLPLTRTDPVGRVTKYTYDCAGCTPSASNIDVTAVQQQRSPGVYDTLASYTYNTKHRPVSRTDAAGKTWTYSYNAAGQPESSTDPLGNLIYFNRYDAMGRLVSSDVALGPGAAVSYAYPACSAMSQVNCDLPQTVTDSEGRTVSYQRDVMDRTTVVTYPDGTTDRYTYTRLDLTSWIDRQGRTTSYTYDANRQLTSVSEPNGGIVSYSYYPNGAVKELTDENGNQTLWGIDAQGRVTSKSYGPFGPPVPEQYTYENSTGRLKSVTDSQGQTKTFVYNSDDTISSVSYSNTVNPTPNVSFTYDPVFGDRASMIDGIGTTSWTYVPVGQNGARSVLSEDGPFSSDSVSYTYDALGRAASLTAGAQTESWTYDLLGRVASHVTGGLGTFNYGYLGRTDAVTSRALAGSSIATTRSYANNTNDRRLTAITNSNGARSFAIGYGPFPPAPPGENPYRVTSVTETGGTAPTKTLCYQYDSNGRLTNTSTSSVAGNCGFTLTTAYSFALDGAGNHTSFSGLGGTSAGTYNSLNQVVTRGGQSFTFDGTGNETGDGSRTYKWNAENQLIEIRQGSNVLATYRYDGLGRRLEVTFAGGTPARFLWCGSKLCARFAGGSVLNRYYEEGQFNPPSIGRLVSTTDHLGSVRNEIDAVNGSVVRAYDYTPFGEKLGSMSINYRGPRYAGLYLDPDVGLYYSYTRVYDPKLGRWMSRDPIAEVGGINLYSYVLGDPINATDAMGLYGTNDCSYYDKRCQEVGGDYYCKEAPKWCNRFPKDSDPDPSRDDDFEGWPRCVRQCLQDCDAKDNADRKTCPVKADDRPAPWSFSGPSYECHKQCYVGCAVWQQMPKTRILR